MSTPAKKAPAPQIKVDDESYRAVAASSMLQEVRLVSSSFDIKPEYFTNEDQGFSLSFDGQMAESRYDSSIGIAAANFLWSAFVKKNRKHLCKIKSQYLVVYTVDKNLNEEAALLFVKTVGRFAIFPYFRVLVSQYSSASSANLPVLPVLKQHF
ncbi:MAG: hypothetical protein OEU92_21890 [Alphaproteobacteria bacterium]|nr:hypothetical protein [Alphaproteobacteria bacterium]